MINRLFILICSIFSISLFGCKESGKGNLVQISPDELKNLQLDTIQLVDVRTPKEYKGGHIKSSKNINYFSSTFSEDINVLDKQKPVYIYCRSGKRSGKSVKVFENAGFIKIYNLEGGLLNWKEKGFQILK